MTGLSVFENEAGLAAAAAGHFLEIGNAILAGPGRFRVALSGGRGPLGMFENLAKRSAELDWARVELYWADERYVPYEHADSNFGAAQTRFISKLPSQPSLHPFDTSQASPEAAAQAYDRLLRQQFGPVGPYFDLCLLGLGPDGHTASLFPGSSSLDEHERLCLAVKHPQSGQVRLTLTLPVINACAQVLVLLSGAEKAGVLKAILNHSPEAQSLPGSKIRPINSRLAWLADTAAAGSL